MLLDTLTDNKVAASAVILERTAKRMKRFFQEELIAIDADITVDQWVVLQQLERQEGQNQLEIAQAVYKDAPTVTRILDLLAKKKLVERVGDTTDRRRFNIELTKLGRQRIKKVWPHIKAARQKAWAGLDEKAIDKLVESLNQVFENIK